MKNVLVEMYLFMSLQTPLLDIFCVVCGSPISSDMNRLWTPPQSSFTVTLTHQSQRHQSRPINKPYNIDNITVIRYLQFAEGVFKFNAFAARALQVQKRTVIIAEVQCLCNSTAGQSVHSIFIAARS